MGRAILFQASFGRARCDRRELRSWASPTDSPKFQIPKVQGRPKAAQESRKLTDTDPDAEPGPSTEECAFASYLSRYFAPRPGGLIFDENQLLAGASVTVAELQVPRSFDHTFQDLNRRKRPGRGAGARRVAWFSEVHVGGCVLRGVKFGGSAVAQGGCGLYKDAGPAGQVAALRGVTMFPSVLVSWELGLLAF